jgi:hypothetical protein
MRSQRTRGRQSRVIAVGSVAALCGLVATGCGSLPSASSPVAATAPVPVVVVHAKPGPFTTITFTVDQEEPAKYDAPSGGTTEVVSNLGTFKAAAAAGEISKQQAAAQSAGDQTLFVVNQSIDGAAESTLFMVTTGQAIDVAMNGLDLDAPDQHELVISAPGGVDSVIAVADSEADSAPFIAGTLGMNGDNFVNNLFMANKSRIDLDTDQNSNVGGSKADIYLPGTPLAGVTMVNGAIASQWSSPLSPTLVACASVPADKWSTTLIQGGLNSLENVAGQVYAGITSYGAWCVESREGRIGYLLQTQQSMLSSLNFQYVLWKKPGDS